MASGVPLSSKQAAAQEKLPNLGARMPARDPSEYQWPLGGPSTGSSTHSNVSAGSSARSPAGSGQMARSQRTKREAVGAVDASLFEKTKRKPTATGVMQGGVRAPMQSMSQCTILMAAEKAQGRVDQSSLEQTNLGPLAANEGRQQLSLRGKGPSGRGGSELEKLSNRRNDNASSEASSGELRSDATTLPAADGGMHSFGDSSGGVTGQKPNLPSVIAQSVKGDGSPTDALKRRKHGSGGGVTHGAPNVLRASKAAPATSEHPDEDVTGKALSPNGGGPVRDGEDMRGEGGIGVIGIFGIGDQEGKIN